MKKKKVNPKVLHLPDHHHRHRHHHHYHHHHRHHPTCCQGDPISHTNKKKEEAADEEEKGEPKVEWIFARISALETKQIGWYREGNTDFKELITSINKIRTDHVKLLDGVEPISELLQTENMKTVFTHFQGIYKFVIHMHNRYGVRLNANTGSRIGRHDANRFS
jgi:hypothetical protein